MKDNLATSNLDTKKLEDTKNAHMDTLIAKKKNSNNIKDENINNQEIINNNQKSDNHENKKLENNENENIGKKINRFIKKLELKKNKKLAISLGIIFLLFFLLIIWSIFALNSNPSANESKNINLLNANGEYYNLKYYQKKGFTKKLEIADMHDSNYESIYAYYSKYDNLNNESVKKLIDGDKTNKKIIAKFLVGNKKEILGTIYLNTAKSIYFLQSNKGIGSLNKVKFQLRYRETQYAYLDVEYSKKDKEVVCINQKTASKSGVSKKECTNQNNQKAKQLGYKNYDDMITKLIGKN